MNKTIGKDKKKKKIKEGFFFFFKDTVGTLKKTKDKTEKKEKERKKKQKLWKFENQTHSSSVGVFLFPCMFSSCFLP